MENKDNIRELPKPTPDGSTVIFRIGRQAIRIRTVAEVVPATDRAEVVEMPPASLDRDPPAND